MADVERRDEHADHAWAELTWRKLAGFVFKYGFIPGFICGIGTLGIFVWTNWYQILFTKLSVSAMQFWYVPTTLFIAGIAFFYINHRLDKRKKR
jgi:hypothetical protein